MAWWADAVLYQIYPRSFADASGDGVGDLAGIRERLDYLEWLGVDGIWLNPTTPSPNADWGYDVSDYYGVDPAFGDLADLDDLVADAGGRGIRVLLDLVPNHSSDQHPWFLDSRSSRASRHRDWYVWADGRAEALPPNNWQGVFGGSAWTWDNETSQYYLHNFLPQQPDLNWWSEAVRDEFDRILQFWFDRGIAGFRIDVAHAIIKDRLLRNDPVATRHDHPVVRRRPLKAVHSMNRPEVHAIFRRWRRLAERYDPPRLLLGETYVLDPMVMASYYGQDNDELQLAFNFTFLHAPFEAEELQSVVEATEAVMPARACPVWMLSTHDAVRYPTRWCNEDEARIRCALLALLGLRGTPVLMYGDELGMPQTDVPPVRRRDMAGRDGARTPMPWSDSPGGGFTRPGVEPWLPFGNLTARNVEAQRADRGSTLVFCRDLVKARREHVELRHAPYTSLPSPNGVWAWRRGKRYAAGVNLGRREVEVEGLSGRILLGTDRARDGDPVDGRLRLRPSEGALLALANDAR
jgi:alpha-glucosidase